MRFCRFVRTTGIAALMLVLGVLSARAQGVIVGTVQDAFGERLPGINVFLEGTTYGAATALDGSFRIEDVPAGEHAVIASAVGYIRARETVTVNDRETVRLDFVLEEAMIEGEEVVVTASRREQDSRRIAASVSTVAPEEIAARNSVSLDDVLQHVPGIQMADDQVSIRGSSGYSFNAGSRVLLLVDGLPMLRPDADGIPFDALPMNQVERIEVLKGPGSALYGGGALGGVINVITRDYPRSPETTVEMFGGLYDPVRYDVWRSKWSEADDARLFGGISIGHARSFGDTGGMWVSLSYRDDAGHLRLSGSRQLQAYSKVGIPLGDVTRLHLMTGLTRRTSDVFLFWNGARDPLNPGELDFGRDTPSSGASDNLINELSFLPSFTHIAGDKLLYAVRGRLFGVLIQPLEDNGDPKPLSQGTVGFRYGGEVQVNYAIRDIRHVTAGITADANATRSSYFADENEHLSQPEGAVFVHWEEGLSERLDVAAGARFDLYRVRQGVVERKLSPKLSASYLLSDWIALRGAFGEGFRVPSVAERFVSNAEYLPLVTNVNIRPEISRSYEIGLRIFPEFRQWKPTFDGALFWNDYWRLVEPTFVAAERAFQFVNITRARVRGAEFNGTAQAPSGLLRFDAGYTYLDARDLTTDQPLVFRSDHLFKASVTINIGRLRAGTDVRLASAPERIDSDFAMFVKDAHMMVPIRVFDLRIGTTWRGVRATLHAKNLLDYYYVERPALLAPPRHLILQVATTF